MKILFLLTQDLESPYGIGRFYPLAKELIKTGQQVQVISLHSNFCNLIETKFIKDGIAVHYIAQMHVLKRGNLKEYFNTPKLLFISLWATIRFTWEILRSDADVIHLGKPHPMNSFAGLFAKMFRNRILFVDCDDLEISNNQFHGEWQKRIVGFFEKWVPFWSNHITTNTTFLKNKMIMDGIKPQKITYIPNGVDYDRFSPPKMSVLIEKKKELGISDKNVIAYIGSLGNANHPIDILLKAFIRVQNKNPSTILMIVGGGESYTHFRKMAEILGINSHVIFVGRVLPEEVNIFYYLADVTVDPVNDDEVGKSRCPIKIFESWACGKPVITGDVGDRALLMGIPPAGLLIKPGDIDAMSTAILKLLDQPKLYHEISKQSIIRAKSYSWEIHAKKILSLYNSYL